MKKLLYLFLCLLSIICTSVSCSDDDEGGATFTETPEESAKGCYLGTYVRVIKGTTDTTRADGEFILSPSNTAYVSNLSMVCTEFKVNSTVPVNISHADDGYKFSNSSSTNALKSSIVGKIDESGRLEAHFTLTQVSGRRTVQFIYVFMGNR